MKRLTMGLTAAVALAFCTAAYGATVPVTQLAGDFAATNTTVVSTNDGVRFGVYADAGLTGGSVYYSGFNGHTLAQVTQLSYTFSYNATDEPCRVPAQAPTCLPGGSYTAAPYLRIFLQDQDGDGYEEDVLLDPSHCATAPPVPQNVSLTYEITASRVRYDDDPCTSLPEETWADVVAAHGDEIITGIYVTQGFAVGKNASALLTHLTLNGTDFCFNCRPVTGAPGPVVSPPPTVIINQAASTPSRVTCKGNILRRLHAPTRRGLRFLGVRATLRGKRLAVSGRTITVDLTGKAEGIYNVRLTIRYRRHSGKRVTVRTTRTLSVVCA